MTALARVMLDVGGLRLDDDDRRRLAHPSVGALIFFARNFASKEQLRALVAEVREVRADLLIAVDNEGGRVQRFASDGFTKLPAMATLGVLYAHDPGAAARMAHAAGYVMARELRDCGIDFSFAPVLDLDYGRSAVIGTRAFAQTPLAVHVLARSLIQGMMQGGMANCGKHFPGHGFVQADSHVDVPRDMRSFNEIFDADARPYAWLGNALLAVMPAHVIYTKLDPLPAGFSKFWLKDVLRSRLGFEGAILSDDLSMEGAHVVGDIVARGDAALNAGCDMVLVCNRPQDADRLLAGLDHADDPKARQRLARLAGQSPHGLPGALSEDAVYQLAQAALAVLA